MSPNYDLAPAGKRLAAFLADDASGEKPLTHLTFRLNFFDELRRRNFPAWHLRMMARKACSVQPASDW
jgi:hypothetical protein